MVWENGGPGSKFSASTRRIVKHRDEGTCQLRYPDACTTVGTEFDHIENLAALGIPRDAPAADDPGNVQLVCIPCHKRKTAAEALAGRRKHLRKPSLHPGLITTDTN